MIVKDKSYLGKFLSLWTKEKSSKLVQKNNMIKEGKSDWAFQVLDILSETPNARKKKWNMVYKFERK